MAKASKRAHRAGKPDAKTFRGADMVRDRRGQAVPTATAAELKNRLGAVLAGALSHGTVAITRHGEIHAVLLSADEYRALLKHAPAPAKALEKEFGQLLIKMRIKRGVQGALSLFKATPAELGRSAHQAAKVTPTRRKRR
jgi:prevent-host-death family protein